MRPFSQVFTCFLFLALPMNLSFGEPAKGELVSVAELDFNADGRVDENDLLSLLEKEGAVLGEEKYSVVHDLEADGMIDHQDLFRFLYGWREFPGKGTPITTAEFRERTQLTTLSGKTLRFRCLAGGVPDCSGEERTVTGGALTAMNGRTVLPIIWGSGTGEPWDILYLTMDGNLGLMGVEKVGKMDEFPGLEVPPQRLEFAGPIPWTTSETIYPGSVVESSGEATVLMAPLKGAYTAIDLACLIYGHTTPHLEQLEDCRMLYGSVSPNEYENCLGGTTKGEGDGPILYSGTGILETPEGIQARADWNLLFGRNGNGLLFVQLCWEFLGQRKCLSYGRIFDGSGSNCLSSIQEVEVEIEHCGVFHNDLTEGVCLSGIVGSGIDIQDWVRLNQQSVAGRAAVTIRHSVPQGSEGLAQLWRFPPACTEGDLLDFVNFTGDGEAVLESPFITVGPNVYVIISPEGDQGAAGGPIAYEVQFDNITN